VEGFTSGKRSVRDGPGPSASMTFDLDRASQAPSGMVPVDGGVFTDYVGWLGWLGPFDLPPFFIDRFEVTNRQVPGVRGHRWLRPA